MGDDSGQQRAQALAALRALYQRVHDRATVCNLTEAAIETAGFRATMDVILGATPEDALAPKAEGRRS